MSKDLTLKQKNILEFIADFIQENNYPPTIKEVGEYFKISIKGSYDHLKALQKKSYIDFEPNKKRSIKLLTIQQKIKPDSSIHQDIPILGAVHAGLPILSCENIESMLKVPKNMFGTGVFFGLKISGDSMIDAGIFESDIAIVKCVSYFNNGEIIVADTGNGVTIKKAYKDANDIRLEAANKKYPDIYTRSARIIGKLVGLIRKY